MPLNGLFTLRIVAKIDFSTLHTVQV